MKKLLLILLFAVMLSPASYSMDRSKMKIVQTMIDSARSQADLNMASKMLFNIWDEEVKQKESDIVKMIPKKMVKSFKASMKSWRKHVELMSIIRSELFKQDFLEPRYYKIDGIESKLYSLRAAKKMQPYVYNMSKSIYYEEKWIELDILINTK